MDSSLRPHPSRSGFHPGLSSIRAQACDAPAEAPRTFCQALIQKAR